MPSGPTPAGCLSAGTGLLLPNVTLPMRSGTPVALGQYRARRNLVVVLLGTGTPDERLSRLLEQLAESRTVLDNEQAEVLVVCAGAAGDLSEEETRSLTVLVDEDGAFHRCVFAVDSVGRAAPAVFITDRYREIYHVFRPADAEWPPQVRDVLEWLVFMNIQCPECGAPEW